MIIKRLQELHYKYLLKLNERDRAWIHDDNHNDDDDDDNRPKHTLKRFKFIYLMSIFLCLWINSSFVCTVCSFVHSVTQTVIILWREQNEKKNNLTNTLIIDVMM